MQELEAIELAEKLRKDHNGIFGVRLFLGHDGHNVCRLEDYDKEIGHGESGRSLLEAIQSARADWRFRILRASPNTILDHAKEAVRLFGDKGDGLFNTAGFQRAVEENYHARLSGEQAEEILERSARVVRLKGGCHWMLLPDGYERFLPDESLPSIFDEPARD